MTTTEMVSVMQAHADGKEIEVTFKGDGEWVATKNPSWDWNTFEYRIKPEPPKPKCVPYESAQEFLQAQREHGPYVELFVHLEEEDRFKCYAMPHNVYNYNVQFSIEEGRFLAMYKCSYEKLCDDCKWQDGTPMGILKK